MTHDATALLARLERYYDAVPRNAARTEDFGPLTLFVTEGPGWPYYARPTLGLSAEVTVEDVDAVRARQRELGIPEAFEWVSETTPGLLAPVQASGLAAHAYPLLVLDPTQWTAHEPPADVRVRQLDADDPEVDAGRAVASLAFTHGGVAVGDEREVTLAPDDGSLERLRDRMRKGLTITVLASDDHGPLGSGSHQPVDGVTEIVGVGTVPAARRRGVGAAITSALVGDALRTGADIIFLSAGSEDVARIYRRLGFVDVGTAYVAESMTAITVDGALLDQVTLAALGLRPPSLKDVGGLEFPLSEDVDLLDPEGAGVGRLARSGELSELTTPVHGAFVRLMRRPDAMPAGLVALAFVGAPPTVEGVAALGSSPVALAPLVGHGRRGILGRDALVRACLAVLPDLPSGSVVVPVPVPAGSDELLPVIADAYGLPVVDASFGTTYGPAVLLEIERVQARHGGVVLFSGLSGSGKSTVARALRDRLVEEGRDVTLLDGDVVRRLLSAGLGFSADERDLNVRRIGYVAAEVARHGGLAVAAPIAPYARSRAAVRAMVEDAGATYVLVHVSTPLEVCEARDRKGLYAKARRGEIESFTGISDPYEPPTDADLTINTADVTVDEAVDSVIAALRGRGLLEAS